jgi:hypothetical protein
MKQLKLIVICVFGVIVLFGILIETGTFSFYKNEVSSSVTSNWSNSKSIVRFKESTEEVSFESIPIVVVYKSKKVGDILSPNPVIIDISDKDFGPFWFPIIKKSGFDFTVICRNKAEVKTDFANGQIEINGEIHFSGHYKIIGFCSTANARNMIVDKVMNDIYENIKKNIK